MAAPPCALCAGPTGRVRLPGGREVLLASGQHDEWTVAELKEWIAETDDADGADASEMRLVHQWRELADDAVPMRDYAASPFFKVLFRLDGGKGGFGSMLRAMGAKKSEHATDNIESMRTLTGRRVRHVNDEKKIAEWKAGEPQRRAAAEKRKKERLERMKELPKHTFDHHKLAVELHETASAVEEGVRAGFEASLEHTKRLLQGEEAVAGGGAATARPAKRVKLAGWDSSDSSGDSSEDDEAAQRAGGSGSASASAASAASGGSGASVGARGGNGKGKAAATTGGASAAAAESDRGGASGERANGSERDGGKPESSAPASAGAAGAAKASTGAPTPSLSSSSKAKGASRAPVAPVAPEALDLAPFASQGELQALGLDRLKAACLAAGLKCGGTLAQRAERLWSVRGLALEDYPEGVVAKKNKA